MSRTLAPSLVRCSKPFPIDRKLLPLSVSFLTGCPLLTSLLATISGRACPRKENAPIRSPMSTLITLKCVDHRRPPRSATSSLFHPIYDARRSYITIAASNIACPDVTPLDLCATDNECHQGKNRWWWP